jgi:hypothetical protein
VHVHHLYANKDRLAVKGIIVITQAMKIVAERRFDPSKLWSHKRYILWGSNAKCVKREGNKREREREREKLQHKGKS